MARTLISIAVLLGSFLVWLTPKCQCLCSCPAGGGDAGAEKRMLPAELICLSREEQQLPYDLSSVEVGDNKCRRRVRRHFVRLRMSLRSSSKVISPSQPRPPFRFRGPPFVYVWAVGKVISSDSVQTRRSALTWSVENTGDWFSSRTWRHHDDDLSK